LRRWNAARRRAFSFRTGHENDDETTIVMDRRDQEFLSKQLRHLPPSPRSDGSMILVMVAVFLAGMTVGAVMLDYQTSQTAARTRTAMSVPASSTVPIAR
jgi:hypothetical protein